MKNRDWHVNRDGEYQACKSPRVWDLLRDNYRLYRFLTELEDILNDVEDETSRLPEIQMLVRRLLVNSYWVQSQYLQPCPKTGTSVLILYDELGFPLTLQTVTFAPGTKSNPRVQSGEVIPEKVDPQTALVIMLRDPLLIRRPLIEVGDRREVGFDAEKIDAWIGLRSKDETLQEITEKVRICRAVLTSMVRDTVMVKTINKVPVSINFL